MDERGRSLGSSSVFLFLEEARKRWKHFMIILHIIKFLDVHFSFCREVMLLLADDNNRRVQHLCLIEFTSI